MAKHKFKVGETVYFLDRSTHRLQSGRIQKIIDEFFCYVRPTGKKYSIFVRTGNLYKDYDEICNAFETVSYQRIKDLKEDLHGLYDGLKQMRRFRARQNKIKERNK